MSALHVRKRLEAREVVLEREVPASRGRVWDSWTTAGDLEAWWGPAGWTTTIRSLDVRPGGLWHFGMGPAGHEPEVWIRAVYSEVIPGSSLSYVEGFSDETGADLDPESNAVTVDFIELDPGATRIVMRFRFSSVDRLEQIARLGMTEGYGEAFDRLDIHLATLERNPS
jgi:uncharacterized protein YndB with AHSA1/START domain